MQDYFYLVYYTRTLVVSFEKDGNEFKCVIFRKPVNIDAQYKQLQSLTVVRDNDDIDYTVMRAMLSTMRSNPTKALVKILSR